MLYLDVIVAGRGRIDVMTQQMHDREANETHLSFRYGASPPTPPIHNHLRSFKPIFFPCRLSFTPTNTTSSRFRQFLQDLQRSDVV
jgi:hypothetical protein